MTRRILLTAVLLLVLLATAPWVAAQPHAGDEASGTSDDADGSEIPAFVPMSTAQSIIADHATVDPALRTVKSFPGAVLGYVTPWNSKGYDTAKTFVAKFDLLAPTWYHWKADTNGKIVVGGKKDIDAKWVQAVRDAATETGRTVKIVPRFLIDFNMDEMFKTDVRKKLLTMIALAVVECKKNKWDGIVFEASYVVKELSSVIRAMANEMHKNNMLLIITASPIQRYFDSKTFAELAPHVDYIQMMTYDYTTMQNTNEPGPNAPLPFVANVIISIIQDTPEYAHKLLAGLNWFGYDFDDAGNNKAVTGEQMIELLKKSNELQWNKDAAEHFFTYTSEEGEHRTVYYPTIDSIGERIKFLEQLGVGVGIWELGQGLPHFYNVL